MANLHGKGAMTGRDLFIAVPKKVLEDDSAKYGYADVQIDQTNISVDDMNARKAKGDTNPHLVSQKASFVNHHGEKVNYVSHSMRYSKDQIDKMAEAAGKARIDKGKNVILAVNASLMTNKKGQVLINTNKDMKMPDKYSTSPETECNVYYNKQLYTTGLAKSIKTIDEQAIDKQNADRKAAQKKDAVRAQDNKESAIHDAKNEEQTGLFETVQQGLIDADYLSVEPVTKDNVDQINKIADEYPHKQVLYLATDPTGHIIDYDKDEGYTVDPEFTPCAMIVDADKFADKFNMLKPVEGGTNDHPVKESDAERICRQAMHYSINNANGIIDGKSNNASMYQDKIKDMTKETTKAVKMPDKETLKDYAGFDNRGRVVNADEPPKNPRSMPQQKLPGITNESTIDLPSLENEAPKMTQDAQAQKDSTMPF